MSRVSKRLQFINGSATLEINEKVAALRAAGVQVYDLGIGEADYPAPSGANDALVSVAKAGVSRYTEVQGQRILRERICRAINEMIAGQTSGQNGGDGDAYSPDDIVVSAGSKHLQYSSILAMCDPGDEVIVQAPYWVSYPDMIRMAGATPVVVSATADEDFVPPVERVAAAITDRTRLIFLNSPNNPTGQLWSREQIGGLCGLVLEHDRCYLLSDEIYGQLVYGGVEHVSPAAHSRKMRERMILTTGLSKAYSMGGWRIGYAGIADPEVRSAILRVGANTISSAPSITQDACIHAFDAADRVEKMRQDFERRANLMNSRLNAMGLSTLPSKGAFYVFPDVSPFFGAEVGGRTLRTTRDISWALLEDAAVASVAGEWFGANRHVRFSYVRPLEELEAACDALEAFVLRHRMPAGVSAIT